MLRYIPLGLSIAGALIFPFTTMIFGGWAWLFFAISVGLSLLGLRDITQRKQSIRRNYPILANIRYLLEEIRPEIRQYFLESETDGAPFNRNKRAIVYQRAKRAPDKRPFGTQQDVYDSGFEWLAHSLAPVHPKSSDFRIQVGGPDCAQPYSLSVFNISAMSFGSLSANAILALNKGAKLGGFAHDTGEGGVSVHHRQHGGDLIWEIGSGYFGCRAADGGFSPETFTATARDPQIRMIEIKLSQGAKPGHGGVLPGAKVTAEIAQARASHRRRLHFAGKSSGFSTPLELIGFISTLRKLSGGKPVGFKLCIGAPHEFMAIVKAMLETGVTPDFIVIDGKEGGTGAAPLEFTDHVGAPLREGLVFAHNCLVGAGLRGRIKLGASARIITAFDMARAFALGADWCNAARGFMFALGCIQSLSCHTDRCPTGVATQDALRQNALYVPDKAERVHHFHESTLKALAEMIGAAGLNHPSGITPDRLMRRISRHEAKSFAEVYPFLGAGELLKGARDPVYARNWAVAQPTSFAAAPIPA